METIWIVVAEWLGTDGEFCSEVYLERSAQGAGECASGLIANMCEEYGIDDVDPTTTWEIGRDGWFYRVRVESQAV